MLGELRMLHTALRHGVSRRGEKCVRITGDYRIINTVNGPVVYLDGVITCSHMGRAYFVLDTKKKATMFRQALLGGAYYREALVMKWAIKRLGILALKDTIDVCLPNILWGGDHPGDPIPTRSRHDLRAKFIAGVPWIKKGRNGGLWFQYEEYDEVAEDHVTQLMKGVHQLMRDSTWRFYDYHWDEGKWTRKFISADAERRWLLREKRKAAKCAAEARYRAMERLAR